MAKKIRVFICYRKVLSHQKNGQLILQKNTEVQILHHILSQGGIYEPWVDSAEIAAGMEWETKIYKELLASDVLLVLIGPSTAQSEWVRRDVALAPALCISIIRIGFDLSNKEMTEEAKGRAGNDRQWMLTMTIDGSQ